MKRPRDPESHEANVSGAPEAGGATTTGSRFGGVSMVAHVLRFVARIARDLEATAYRRLRDMEVNAKRRGEGNGPGAPKRVREVRIH